MKTTMTIRTDSAIKQEAQDLFSELGLDMTTAINMFLRQVVRTQAVPLTLKLDRPNAETIAALKEGEKLLKDPNTKRYGSFSEILAEVSAQ